MGSTCKEVSWSKNMSLDLWSKMNCNGSQPPGKKHVYCVESYTILYAMITLLSWHIMPARKEATYCTRVNIQSYRWAGYILNSSACDLVWLHKFLRRYLVIFRILTRAEVVTYPHRIVTIVCDASQHILRSCICFEIQGSGMTGSQILH